ncbi:U32 family peptidase [Clostridium chrysemydis]|uniref:U32 family peptidase n=1 Tax=Clostridium chrysemydis TaxID=2665504 RepID=UPI0018832408|nr:U32 family peptidase [Clostridium chrysemydis]
MNKIEVLAPAGSLESLYAAINNGCDAIYLGGNKFSARAYASNFDNEQMQKAVDYAHSYGVSVYVTMNTLLKEDELKKAIKYVGYLYEIGVDALIIQDLGLYREIRENYKDFEIHASTQMTIHNGLGAIYFKDKGFHRIVLSRELSFDEIKYISDDLKIETEMFVHGALCICYSGQCLMSSMIGGRSGNRGRCAQPCRMEYTLKNTKGDERRGYLLSPKDMCTIEDVKDIIDTGTYSLKIEGRMKRPEYVAGVVRNYRKAVDKELNKELFDLKKGKEELLQLFNRGGFTKAFLKKDTGKDMMSYNFPKNTGIYLGKVLPSLEVLLEGDISLGDGVRHGDSGFVINKIIKGNEEVKKASKGDKVKLFPLGYKKSEDIYKMADKDLNEDLKSTIKPYIKKIPLNLLVKFKLGESVELTTNFKGTEYKVSGSEVLEATNKPLDKERIIKALSKSGDYPYKFNNIEFSHFTDGFLRVGEFNELRRELFDKVIKETQKSYRRRRPNEVNKFESKIKETKLKGLVIPKVVLKEQYNEIKDEFKYIIVDVFSRDEDGIKIRDIEEMKKNNEIILKIPNILKGEIDKVIKVIDDLKEDIFGILTSNVGIINKYKNELEIIGDYKLNIFNSKALDFYSEDINLLTISQELNRKEMKSVLKGFKGNISTILYGKTELMISEYCPIGSTFGGKTTKKDCSRPCEKDRFNLIDRVGESLPLMTDIFCRSYILNSLGTNLINDLDDLKEIGIDTFRLDFTNETKKEVREIIDELKGNKEVDDKNYTKGHYRRGVE